MVYMTDDERAQPMQHICNHFTFVSRLDLKGGVTLIPHAEAKANEVPVEHIMSDVASFTSWWMRNVHSRLNGFSGLDTIDWKIKWN